MQVCTSLKTDNHASTPLLSFLQAGCPSCRPTNSVKALEEVNQSMEYLEQVESNLLVVAEAVGALHDGHKHWACGAGVRLLRHRELILRVVPETRYNHSTKRRSYDTIRYDTRCYFNVRSTANTSQLNLPHGNRQLKKCKNRKTKKKKDGYAQK